MSRRRNKASHQGHPDCSLGGLVVKSVTGGPGIGFAIPGPSDRVPRQAGLIFGEMAMSNMNDAMGLCVRTGRAESQYQTEFEPATGTLWGYFNPKDGTPCYSLGLLNDILQHDRELMANQCHVDVNGMPFPVYNYVTASRIPGVFNVGGDLALFVMLIKAQDRAALANYAKLCIDNIYPRTQ